MYCDRSGLSQPYGNCSLGYYCPPGQVSPTPTDKRCQPGHFCPAASVNHYVCPSGMYQTNAQQGECNDCPEGYYCDPVEANAKNESGVNSTTHGVVNPVVCPLGYYCARNTTSYKTTPCLKGYFGNRTKLSSHDQCYPCTPGYYCPRDAMHEPEGLCNVGYYCSGKATTSTPISVLQGGGMCEKGYYCESGYSAPLPCPKGTYGDKERLGHLNECTDCDGGKYCPQDGLAAPNGSCLAGYYCTSRAILPNPVRESYGDECPKGFYCPLESTVALACPPGTFNNNTKATRPQDCQVCTGGSYCSGYGNTNPDGKCSSGHYCRRAAYTEKPIEFTNLVHNSSDEFTCPIYSVNQTGNICPSGTYCPEGTVDPIVCDAGKHCDISGLSEPLGNCTQGYYCAKGSVSAKPVKCTPGHYCPEGTPIEVPCPIGTYNGNEGSYSLKHCSNCTTGYYCPHSGMTEAAFRCLQGYYCPAGSWKNDTMECPAGYYCPTGVGAPIPCPAGE